MISLTYIHHDCFLLSTPAFDMVFDCFGTMPSRALALIEKLIHNPAAAQRPLYVLVSHHHKDHFSRSIFDWQRMRPATRYIISSDTRRAVAYLLRPASKGSTYTGHRPCPGSVSVLRPGESYDDGTVWVRAFGSTDTGNSYLVGLPGTDFSIFHAGDLNTWIWKDESTPAEVRQAIAEFDAIIKEIAAFSPKIDLAMFPVDSRIGTDYFTGASMFVRLIDVRRFFPMHFCLADDEAGLSRRRADAVRFDLYANPLRGEYIGLSSPGDTWTAAQPSSVHHP